MNGRMYDAKLRRFLSPDNFIQDPFNTQSFNRYGYVWNNPLKYADFSGEELITFLAIVGGALLGGYLGGATANGDFNPANWDWQDSSTWIGIGIGALVGAFVGYQVAAGNMTLLVTGGANTTQGFIPLANVSITKAGASIATAITGTIASIAFSPKTKREQRQENQSLDAPNSGTVGSTNCEIGSPSESTSSPKDNTVVEADDVIQGYVPLPMLTEPRYFDDVRDAYDFMQGKSIEHGVEVSAWELENGGAVVLPYHRNNFTTSHNNYDKVHNPVKLLKGREYISYNGNRYKLSAQVHTHPFIGNGINGGFSGADRNLANFLDKPVKVIHHNQILEHRPGMGVDRYGYIKVNNLGRWR